MKNKQKGFIVPLLIGIIALLLIGGGAYIYLNKESATATSQEVKTSTSKTEETKNADTKISACNNQVPLRTSSGKVIMVSDIGAKMAGLKALNYELMVYLNNHSSYPTSLANFDNNGIKEDYSNKDYLYAYYPKVNPSHYHVGMKIQNGATCNSLTTSVFKTKANFNSKAASYVDGFDGTDPDTLDFNDSQK